MVFCFATLSHHCLSYSGCQPSLSADKPKNKLQERSERTFPLWLSLIFFLSRKCLKLRSSTRGSSDEERRSYRYWWTSAAVAPTLYFCCVCSSNRLYCKGLSAGCGWQHTVMTCWCDVNESKTVLNQTLLRWMIREQRALQHCSVL